MFPSNHSPCFCSPVNGVYFNTPVVGSNYPPFHHPSQPHVELLPSVTHVLISTTASEVTSQWFYLSGLLDYKNQCVYYLIQQNLHRHVSGKSTTIMARPTSLGRQQSSGFRAFYRAGCGSLKFWKCLSNSRDLLTPYMSSSIWIPDMKSLTSKIMDICRYIGNQTLG